jgi:hypothetical protein
MKRSSRELNFLIEEARCRELEQLVCSGKGRQGINDVLRIASLPLKRFLFNE